MSKIITADERIKERKGITAAIVGPYGIGKTSLVRTTDIDSTLLIDTENGDLAIQDVLVDTFRPKGWTEVRDVVCIIGGPNEALPPTAVYSKAHYDNAIKRFGGAEQFTKYTTYVFDSLTTASRLGLQFSEQQPDAFTERGKKDIRNVYGILAREMLAAINHIQRVRDKNTVFIVLLERAVDEFGHAEWALQLDGAKTARELPGIIDVIVTMQFVDFGDSKPVRAFVCTSPNQWAYPAKDRSGLLDPIEPPHLGKLLEKLITTSARKPLDHSLIRPVPESSSVVEKANRQEAKEKV